MLIYYLRKEGIRCATEFPKTDALSQKTYIFKNLTRDLDLPYDTSYQNLTDSLRVCCDSFLIRSSNPTSTTAGNRTKQIAYPRLANPYLFDQRLNKRTGRISIAWHDGARRSPCRFRDENDPSTIG